MRRTEQFLGWVALSLAGRPDLAWWDISRWVSQSSLLAARVTIAALVSGLVVALGTAIVDPSAILWAAAAGAVFAGVMTGRFIWPGKLQRAQPPLALVPRRPRSAREATVLAAAALTGIAIRPVLRRLWIAPVTKDGTPDTSYRACRVSTVVDMLACAYTGLPLAVLGLAAEPGLLGWAGFVSGFMVLISLSDGKVFLVKQTELVLLRRWRHRVSVHRLLEEAVTRGTLRYQGPYYQFADPAEQERLAAAWAEDVRARARRIPDAVAAASVDGRAGVRVWLLSQLSRKIVTRIGLSVAIGVSITLFAWFLITGELTRENALGSIFGLVLGLVALLASTGIRKGLTRLIRWSLWRIPDLTPRAAVTTLAVASLAADLLVWLAGPGPARHGIGLLGLALLPAALVAGIGGWLCVLAHRRWHAATSWVFRHLADALVAVVTCAAILLLHNRSVLGIEAVSGLLLPVAIWVSILTWRAMNDSEQVAVRACADLTVSVLLGGSLALTLIWLAGLLDMPVPEVAALRDVTADVAELVEVPWWGWLTAYALLIAASLAFALRPAWLKRAGLGPDRLDALSRRMTKMRLVPATEITRRVTSAVHIGLLMVLLTGLAGQVAVVPVLRAKLIDRYTLTLADNLRARDELAAYVQIQREFGNSPPSQAALAPLAALVAQIDHVGDTPTELDLAQRLGELQATTVAAPPPEQAEATGPALKGDAGEQLGELDTEEKHGDNVKEQVDNAAELATSAIAQALSIPRIGDATIVQIIREYLSGLIEFSPLKDVLADRLVVPDPDKLKDAAAAEVTKELETTQVTDPAAARRLLTQTGVVAAVKLANQARYLQEDTGPCSGCAAPAHDNSTGNGSDDDNHDVEPPAE